ncbi:MAG: DUF63 family protein [archaeon]
MLKELANATQEFINRYYLDPIRDDSGYNLVNTLTWSILFVIAIMLLYQRFFKKDKIKIDLEFMKSLLGWIIFASALRIIRDLNISTSGLLVTPASYILIFTLSFSTLLMALHLKKTRKIRLFHTWGITGYGLATITLIKVITAPEHLDTAHFLLICAIWSGWFILLLLAKKYIAKRFLSTWNMAAIMAHLLDATGTFVALTYAYGESGYEKHVLGRAAIEFLQANNILLINGSGSWIMFALKLAVIPLALWAIDRYSEDKTENRFLKMIIIILGLAIGMRNSLQVLTLGNGN